MGLDMGYFFVEGCVYGMIVVCVVMNVLMLEGWCVIVRNRGVLGFLLLFG